MKTVIAIALATMAFTSFAADVVVTPVAQHKVAVAPLAAASAPVAVKHVEKKVEKKVEKIVEVKAPVAPASAAK